MTDTSVIEISSDKYFNDPDHEKHLGDIFGADVIPVDMNGAAIDRQKHFPQGRDNLIIAEVNMRRRFSLGR